MGGRRRLKKYRNYALQYRKKAGENVVNSQGKYSRVITLDYPHTNSILLKMNEL